MRLGYTQTQLLIGPQSSATTARTASLDTSTYGAEFISVYVPVNAEANTNSTNVVLDVLACDTTVVSSHTSLGTVLIDNASANVGVAHVNWKGRGRYLRVTATPDTTTNGAVVVGGIIAVVNPDIRGLTDASTGSVTRIA